MQVQITLKKPVSAAQLAKLFRAHADSLDSGVATETEMELGAETPDAVEADDAAEFSDADLGGEAEETPADDDGITNEDTPADDEFLGEPEAEEPAPAPTKKAAPPKAAPAKTAPAAKAAAPASTKAKEISNVDLARAFNAYTKKSKAHREKGLALIKSYKVKTYSDIPQAKRAEVLKRLA